MLRLLSILHDVVWGIPTVAIVLGIGLYLSVVTWFPQIRLLPGAIRQLFRKPGQDEGAVTPFRAMCTALGATVGTGNLAGVAGAICLGGPGAVFWMWICGFIGMATKFSEIVLAYFYRTRRGKEFIGGPMYLITNGMGSRWKWLAAVYSLLGLVAAIGIGNATQVDAVVSGCNKVLSLAGIGESTAGNLIMGILLAAILGTMLMGGAGSVGKIAERLVPFSASAYVILCGILIFFRRGALHVAFAAIIKGAFHPRAFTGGIIGSVCRCMSVGCARGVFTNEAGMGTASIVHASANARHPVEQGMMGLLEVMIDTLVICTLTALVILCGGTPVPYGKDLGISLTISAFRNFYGDWVSVLLTLFLCSFAFATMMGWGLYGARCCEFLFGPNSWKNFIWAEMGAIILGSVIHTEYIWLMADTINGMMILPNLIALTALSPKLIAVTKAYGKGSPVETEQKGRRELQD